MKARVARVARLAALGVALTAAAAGAETLAAQPTPPDSVALLTLLFPNSRTGQTLEERRPLFVWQSVPVPAPPGPWQYDISIRNVATRQTRVVRNLADTTFRPTFDLELNTSYRWGVTARLTNGDSVRVESVASFVIANPDVPLTTLLYQNFPNPFPTPESATTCVWFDLREAGRVRLDVYDLRGSHVQTLVPGTELSGELAAGRYGRGIGTADAGCDPRLAWDGRSSSGRQVPAGVYLLRLRAHGVDEIKKILYRGR